MSRFLLLTTVLAAAPIHIIAVHGAQSAGAQKKLSAIPGATTIDASSLHEYLLRTEGLHPMQDFALRSVTGRCSRSA